MKTKLLKRIRKQAHDKFRIAPHYAGDKWCIEAYTNYGWHHLVDYNETAFLTLDKAIEYIAKFRENEFRIIATELLNNRRYNKRLEQVKDL